MRITTLAAALLMIVSALSLSVTAQPTPEEGRVLTVHLAGVTRAYASPMRATSARIARIEGISEVAAVRFQADVATFTLRTALDAEELAGALGCEVFWARGDELMIGASDDDRARRAEARWVLSRIADALLEHVRDDDEESVLPMRLQRAGSVAEKLRVLELDPVILNGRFWKAADFHLTLDDERFKAWAGSHDWKGLESLGSSNDYWFMGPTMRRTTGSEQVIEESFVGVEGVLSRWYWGERVRWADYDAMIRSTRYGNRAEMHGDRLVVQEGADYIESVLERVAGKCYADRAKGMNEWPAGTGWMLERHVEGLSYGRAGYSIRQMSLDWREDDDSQRILTASLMPVMHPHHLRCEVNMTALIDSALERLSADEKPETLDVGAYVTWIVGPDAGPEVFEARRAEAEAVFAAVRQAVSKLDGAGVSGRFDDSGLLEKLGADLPEIKAFEPAAYELRRQPFGHYELQVGTPMSGGRMWELFDGQTGEVIRSSR